MTRNLIRLLGGATIFLGATLSAYSAQAASVSVTSGVTGPDKVEAFLQSTDKLDFGSGCQIGNSSYSCPASNSYSHGPKNMKFLVCLPDSGSYTFTDNCKKLTNSQSGCKSNNISGALCGTISNPIYPLHAQPQCQYRTNSSSAGWDWKVTQNGNSYKIDCSMYGLEIRK